MTFNKKLFTLTAAPNYTGKASYKTFEINLKDYAPYAST